MDWGLKWPYNSGYNTNNSGYNTNNNGYNTIESNFFKPTLSHRIHVIMVYMLTWLGYIDGIHVTIYIYIAYMDPMGLWMIQNWIRCFQANKKCQYVKCYMISLMLVKSWNHEILICVSLFFSHPGLASAGDFHEIYMWCPKNHRRMSASHLLGKPIIGSMVLLFVWCAMDPINIPPINVSINMPATWIRHGIHTNRRKFRSQTSDNMDRWKAEQGRGREKRKIRREKIRRERVRKKDDADARKGRKVAKHCVFPMICALKRRVRSQLARWAMKNCTPLWREAHFEVKMCKTHQVRTTFGSWDVEKVHAVVARSTFPSQKC